MATISLSMIVRNEADVLERCLSSVSDLVDEIILVDTGSTDTTKEIAAKFTEKIYDFPWIDDFAAARNEAFSHASCDYCMWLDADDVLLEADRVKFAALKKELNPGVHVVMMRYNTGFDEVGNVTFSFYRERIVKNHVGMRWKGAVHEVIETWGNTVYSECAVTHWKLHPSDPDRNLRIFEKLLTEGKPLAPRQQFYYGRELYYHQRYREALDVFEKFLEEPQGWLENKLDACRIGAECLRQTGAPERGLFMLLRSFVYDTPRAETSCEIARYFFDREAWGQAAYWYERALACERNDGRGGFVLPEAYGYIPYIQLCVCYSRLGRQGDAERMNELAAACKPDSPAVTHNRAYFAALRE